eukprot:Gregarina_sp_Poly_1__5486@NODE_289_length_9981_cov_96_822574_g250_i0_p2_GENE_NODE_289_length_9981_cov_96_822574_g250_i0NODE_289_length_9981_cov_96_822574_g250_i0_p2_ORF_typecomplete_len625_score48_38Scs3p/PF10261_9/4_5e03Scs3p/PF10261_9/0_0018Auxin_repressed/PF05564_12/1_6Auxin_repressed/PF05564_12/1_2e04PAP2/PF01569_21/1_1e03PAP2/PF01569_21/3_3e03PAP2/PF01569_21/0_038_NODE_289_length_9981_cov_96_822574_g250_i0761950
MVPSQESSLLQRMGIGSCSPSNARQVFSPQNESLSSSTQVNRNSTPSPIVSSEEDESETCRHAARSAQCFYHVDSLCPKQSALPPYEVSVSDSVQHHSAADSSVPVSPSCVQAAGRQKHDFFESPCLRHKSSNSCMSEATRKALDEPGPESPPVLEATQSHVSVGVWSSAWVGLWRFQAVGAFLLLFVILIGASFAGIKWSYVSPKLHGVSVSNLRLAIQRSHASRPDYEFAQKVLFQPSNSLAEPKWRQTTDMMYPLSEAMHPVSFSVFIPSAEKRAFRMRRHHDATYPPNFSTALICSDFSPEVESVSYDWTYTIFSSPKPPNFNAELEQIFAPISHFQDTVIPHMAKTETSVLGLGRRCVLWSDGTKILRLSDMPRIIQGSNGIFCPNYPGETIIHGMLRNPVWMSLIITFAWSHSLFTGQSWTGVHLPRLVFYGAVGVYRWIFLYLGLGELEKLHQIQTFLRTADDALKISNVPSRPTTDFFDFSDHLVATFTCVFILSTELFCLFEFSLRPAMQDSEQQTSEIQAEPLISLDSRSAGQFERPWKLPKMILYAWIGLIVLMIGALIYGGFATAAFFHSPSESLIGYAIGAVGIWGVFWLLLSSDYLIHNFWFWHNTYMTH